MKLKKLLFWQDQDQDQVRQSSAVSEEKLDITQDSLSNVIKLPISTPLSEPIGLQIDTPKNNELTKNLGLFDEAEIKDF